jgi:hypothetical protein
VLDLYACALRFDDDPAPVFDEVRERIATWIGKSYGAEHQLDALSGEWAPEPGHEIRWETLVPPDGHSARWACSWRRPLRQDGEVHLTTKCRVQRTREATSAWFRQVAHSTVRAVRPVEFRWTRPPVIRTLLQEQRVVADGRRLLDEPEIYSAIDVNEKLIPLLLDSARSLPVIVVTSPMDHLEPLIDDSKLAGLVAGVAHVLRLKDTAATFALTDAFGKARAVYDGAVRLYWPGFTHDSEMIEHPLFQRRELAELRRSHGSVGDYLLRIVGAAAALHRPETWLDADYDLADARARKRMRREQRERFRQMGLPEDVLRALDEYEAANTEFSVEHDRLIGQLDDAHARILDLETTVQRLTDEIRRRSLAARANGPESVYEAVRLAAEDCKRLIFLPEAFISASESRYQQPDRVYDALMAADRIAQQYASNQLTDGISAAFEDIGLDYAADVSETAHSMFRDEYSRKYEGREILLGPHLRFGHGTASKMLRIYFHRDDVNRTFVIGHVGSHLRDSANSREALRKPAWALARALCPCRFWQPR